MRVQRYDLVVPNLLPIAVPFNFEQHEVRLNSHILGNGGLLDFQASRLVDRKGDGLVVDRHRHGARFMVWMRAALGSLCWSLSCLVHMFLFCCKRDYPASVSNRTTAYKRIDVYASEILPAPITVGFFTAKNSLLSKCLAEFAERSNDASVRHGILLHVFWQGPRPVIKHLGVQLQRLGELLDHFR